ncbi:hypothetical protein [Cohnella nanjingensis]|uniref:DUF1450 domain-containing protein n=1 Tax=Cohnella nanjingensis TaxID=1387779 RepID=A0A7X0RWH1_9BACL|nr:hypothetical protein [Cohnella nanjingensis]MBB6674958.1 hypothetical protein [Cohnella nanjingensis]
MSDTPLRIACCIRNLTQHQYGAELNALAAEGVRIDLTRCLSQCVGCRTHRAFQAHGKWHAVEAGEDFKLAVYACAPEREPGGGADGGTQEVGKG